MADHAFFNESKEQSKIKSAVVSKYFGAWARVIVGAQDRFSNNPNPQIAYIDLFAGPGRYKDGTQSTPLLVLEKAINNEKLRNRLVAVFNDKDEHNTQSLQESIESLPGIETLKHPPRIYNNEIGSEIIRSFEDARLVPTLCFVDPWGYKGLSLRLINAVLKNWACECIFFFNYNRINMGLGNELVQEHMEALFGEERASLLSSVLDNLNPAEREATIVEELCNAIRDSSEQHRYVLPFGFKDERGERTRHHLIFASKGFRGYEIMKDIMARESSHSNQGVASFQYSPADRRQPLLFQLSRPLDDLQSVLLNDFAGKRLTMRQIYEQHNVDTPFVAKNYKDALLQMEQANLITTAKHKKGSFGDNVLVTFPTR